MKWHTEKRKINDLIPFEINPRQMTEKQVKDLQKSLKKFDLAEIPAINKDNTIIAGHQRINILKLLGRENEQIDVRVPDKKLTKKEVEEYNIRSNKNIGEWDWDILANEFEIDDLYKWGFDDEEIAFNNTSQKPKKVNLIPYEKTHILITINPQDYDKIKKHIDQIKTIEGIEIEQSNN